MNSDDYIYTKWKVPDHDNNDYYIGRASRHRYDHTGNFNIEPYRLPSGIVVVFRIRSRAQKLANRLNRESESA